MKSSSQHTNSVKGFSEFILLQKTNARCTAYIGHFSNKSDSFRHLQITRAHLPVECAVSAFIKRDAGNGRGGKHRRRFART